MFVYLKSPEAAGSPSSIQKLISVIKDSFLSPLLSSILTVFIFVCCHIYGHKMGMTAPRLVFSLLCLSKKRGGDKRISSVKVLSFLYKKKNFPASFLLDFLSYFRTESIPTLRLVTGDKNWNYQDWFGSL